VQIAPLESGDILITAKGAAQAGAGGFYEIRVRG